MKIIKVPFPTEIKDLLVIKVEIDVEAVKAAATAQPAKDTPTK